MQSFYPAFSAVLKLVILLVIGYLYGKLTDRKEEMTKVLNDLVYKILMPVNMFSSIVKADLKQQFDSGLVLFCLIVTAISILVCCLLVRLFEKDRRVASAMIQAMYRGNFMLFGFSIIGNFYVGQNIVTASILVAIVVPFLNVSSVLLMSYYNGRNVGFSQLAVSVITNPLIIAALIAAMLNLFGIMPPEIIIGSCDTLSSMATPLALIALGASMKATDIRNNFSRLSLISLVKLILLPLAATTAGIIAGYRGLDLFCVMILFAAPSAISSYSLAQSMGSDGTLAGEAVMVTTVLSSATIICWICALMALGYV